MIRGRNNIKEILDDSEIIENPVLADIVINPRTLHLFHSKGFDGILSVPDSGMMTTGIPS